MALRRAVLHLAGDFCLEGRWSLALLVVRWEMAQFDVDGVVDVVPGVWVVWVVCFCKKHGSGGFL
jgi:hypothetical protein